MSQSNANLSANGERSSRSPLLDGICEMTLQSSDPSALAGFYREAFDCEEISREDGRIWLACGSQARLGIWSPGTKEFGDQGGRHVHFALSCAPGALDRIVERLSRLGITHRGPVEHDGGDRSLYVEDPEGNIVEAWDFFQRGEGRRHGIAALG